MNTTLSRPRSPLVAVRHGAAPLETSIEVKATPRPTPSLALCPDGVKTDRSTRSAASNVRPPADPDLEIGGLWGGCCHGSIEPYESGFPATSGPTPQFAITGATPGASTLI